jgi:phosphohistidine phosphatase
VTLLLMHHAEAQDARLDSRRPLSPDGQAQAARVAAAVAAAGFAPELIRHSGKLRSKQTAETLWLAGDHRARLEVVRGLQPGDPPGWMRDQVAGDTRTLALVGHMPHLARLLELLRGGASGDAAPDFPRHGAVGLEADGDRWREVRRFPAA